MDNQSNLALVEIRVQRFWSSLSRAFVAQRQLDLDDEPLPSPFPAKAKKQKAKNREKYRGDRVQHGTERSIRAFLAPRHPDFYNVLRRCITKCTVARHRVQFTDTDGRRIWIVRRRCTHVTRTGWATIVGQRNYFRETMRTLNDHGDRRYKGDQLTERPVILTLAFRS